MSTAGLPYVLMPGEDGALARRTHWTASLGPVPTGVGTMSHWPARFGIWVAGRANLSAGRLSAVFSPRRRSTCSPAPCPACFLLPHPAPHPSVRGDCSNVTAERLGSAPLPVHSRTGPPAAGPTAAAGCPTQTAAPV